MSISWGSSKSSSSSSSSSSSRSSRSSGSGSSSSSSSVSSTSVSSASGSSDSCPEICIRANGENHYLTGTFLTNANEDTEKCGYILTADGLDYTIFVMQGGGVEVGPNNGNLPTFYPDLEAFYADNPYGFSECTSSSSGSSGSSSFSVSSASSLSGSSSSKSSGSSGSKSSGSLTSSSASSSSSSGSGSSDNSPDCGEFCLTWTDDSTVPTTYGSMELTGEWIPAGDPFLDGVPDLPTNDTYATSFPYAGYCYMLATGTPDGNLAWYQGYVDKGGGVIEPNDEPHLYHDDVYQGSFDDFQLVLLPVAEYKIAPGACPSSSSSTSSASSGSGIDFDCGDYCLKSTDADGNVEYNGSPGFFQASDPNNEPAGYQDKISEYSSDPAEVIGSCVYSFPDVAGAGSSWNMYQPIRTTQNGNVYVGDHIHFYDQAGNHVESMVTPVTSVIFTIDGTEYEITPGDCPSFSSSSTSSSFNESSSSDCKCLKFDGEEVIACREYWAQNGGWIYNFVTPSGTFFMGWDGGTDVYLFGTDTSLEVYTSEDEMWLEVNRGFAMDGVDIQSCESASSSSGSNDCGDLCVWWFVRTDTGFPDPPTYATRSETFTGISGTYTDYSDEEQPTCIYTGFAGMGIPSLNGGEGYAYDIRKDALGEYRMYNLSNGNQSNRAGQNGEIREDYQIDNENFYVDHGACPSTSSSSSFDSSSSASSSGGSSSQTSSSISESSQISTSSSSTYIPEEILSPIPACVTTTILNYNYFPAEYGGTNKMIVPLQTINSTKSLNQAQNWALDGPGEGPYINPEHIPQQVLDFRDSNPNMSLAAYYLDGVNLENYFSPRGHFIYMFIDDSLVLSNNPIFHYRPAIHTGATEAEKTQNQLFIRFFDSAQHWHTVFETIVCIDPTPQFWRNGELKYECVGESFDCLRHRCKNTDAPKDFITNYNLYTPLMKQAQTIDSSDGSRGSAYWRYKIDDEEYGEHTFWHGGDRYGVPPTIEYVGDDFTDYAQKYSAKAHGMHSGWHMFQDAEDTPGELFELWWVYWSRNSYGVPFRKALPGDYEYNPELSPDDQGDMYYPPCPDCAPREIEVTFPTTSDFASSIQYFTVTVTYCKGMYYYQQQPEQDYYSYFDPNQNIFRLQYYPPTGFGTPEQQDGYWDVLYGNAYFAYQDTTPTLFWQEITRAPGHPSSDPCDPTGSWQITDSIYYNGYYITITDPNAGNPPG